MKVKNRKRLKNLSRLLFVIYMGFTLYFMLFSEGFGRSDVSAEYRYNLTPFKEIKRFWHYKEQVGYKWFLINLFGNVACFMPFGFFLPAVMRSVRNIFTVTIVSFCFSFMIECIQLVYKIGCFDVDDMMLNTLGGFIGYIAYAIIYQLKFKPKKRRRKRAR